MVSKLSVEPVRTASWAGTVLLAVLGFMAKKGWLINESDIADLLVVLSPIVAGIGELVRRKVMPLPTVIEQKNGVMQEAYDLGIAHAKKQQAAMFPPPAADERVGD